MFPTEDSLFVLRVAIPTKPDYFVGFCRDPFLDHYYSSYIYINDLSNVSNIPSSLMFADDTTLVLSHSNFSSLIKDANVGLTAYATWFRQNKLSLNIKKSNCHFQWQKIIV